MPAFSVTLRAYSARALLGLRLYWPAFLAIQCGALGFAALYFTQENVRDFCREVGGWKVAGGVWFAGIANVISGGVVPELLKLKFRPPELPRPTPPELLHQFTMLAVLGVSVDVFYRFQDWLWNGQSGWQVLLAKILIDQFVYTPCLALLFVVLWYLWRETGFDLRATWRAASFSLVTRRIGEILVSNIFFWVPVLLAIYSLPRDLQFILFLFVNAAWCILLIFIARQQVAHSPTIG